MVLSCILGGCNEVMKTSEGVPRKVVVRQDNTPLYTSYQLDKSSPIVGKQWAIWFMVEENKDYYKISATTNPKSEDFLYIKSQDIFEWNNPFCLHYKGSPKIDNRPQVKHYKTLKDLKNNESVSLVEKQEHSLDFNPNSCQPIIEEVEPSIYYMATLYDDVVDGQYKFLGHYDFAYVRYSKEYYTFYRYVSKNELSEQIRALSAISTFNSTNINPTIINGIVSNISSLIGLGQDFVTGVNDLNRIFGGKNIPKPAQGGVLDTQNWTSEKIDKNSTETATLVNDMTQYLHRDSNWNSYNYSLIPVEWIENN